MQTSGFLDLGRWLGPPVDGIPAESNVADSDRFSDVAVWLESSAKTFLSAAARRAVRVRHEPGQLLVRPTGRARARRGFGNAACPLAHEIRAHRVWLGRSRRGLRPRQAGGRSRAGRRGTPGAEHEGLLSSPIEGALMKAAHTRAFCAAPDVWMISGAAADYRLRIRLAFPSDADTSEPGTLSNEFDGPRIFSAPSCRRIGVSGAARGFPIEKPYRDVHPAPIEDDATKLECHARARGRRGARGNVGAVRRDTVTTPCAMAISRRSQDRHESFTDTACK